MSAAQTFRNTLVVIITVAAAYALWVNSHILIVLFIAIIVASAVRPMVLWVQARGISQGLATLLVYFMIGVAMFVVGGLVIPSAVNQFSGYIQNEDRLASRIIIARNWLETTINERTGSVVGLPDADAIHNAVSNVADNVRAIAPDIIAGTGGLIGDFVLMVVMGVYWLTSRDEAVEFNTHLFPVGRRGQIEQIINEIETAMGAYVRGIILVCTFVGVANFILMTILGVPNAVTLGFIIGITTAIPVIGGYIGGGTAVLLAILSSPIHALFALTSFVLVQQVENHYLTPRVMSRSVALNPILIIVFLFVGFGLGGVVGAVIAIPIAGSVMIIFRHLVFEPRQAENQPHLVEGGILLSSANTEIPLARATDDR